MAAWSQSAFLQALGWAMLNSLWQMALLYSALLLFPQIFRFSGQKRYYLAISSLGIGVVWFVYTFTLFYTNGGPETILSQHRLAPTSKTWNLVLSAASLTYLFLLLVPAYRLFQNWRYIGYLKKFGLQKTAMEHRLFVKKASQRLGIKHAVHVYLSQLVQSPVTIGYIKPIILLPFAAMNNLSQQQVEAVLLHELSHIKRYDYVVNFIIMLLQTLFYFNPFVKKFVSFIEFEREKCCDELVLQFEYDKVSYAAALLLLEKSSLCSDTLALAAAGKSHLLQRIEKILGLHTKVRFSFNQCAGMIASILLVFFINSILFVNKEVKLENPSVAIALESPLFQYDIPASTETFSKANKPAASRLAASKQSVKNSIHFQSRTSGNSSWLPTSIETGPRLIPVVFNNERVTREEKAHIVQTLEKTKTVLVKSKWKEVELSIADGMTVGEKKAARTEYLKAVDKIDWENLETRLKSRYATLDWSVIISKLDAALAGFKLDSLQTNYQQILTQIDRMDLKSYCSKPNELPLPDLSAQTVKIIKDELNVKIDSIKGLRNHKIVNF